jgi:hypothetical protein
MLNDERQTKENTMNTQEERKQIAVTILEQLGGNRFMVMTGARHFVALESGVRFRLPIGKAKRCEITLTACDDYTMEFFKKAADVTPKEAHSGIYCDQLQDF